MSTRPLSPIPNPHSPHSPSAGDEESGGPWCWSPLSGPRGSASPSTPKLGCWLLFGGLPQPPQPTSDALNSTEGLGCTSSPRRAEHPGTGRSPLCCRGVPTLCPLHPTTALRAMGFPTFRWGTREGWACSIKELCMPWGGYGL